MQDLNDNIPELKIEFMADGMGDGLILLEQDSCGNVDRVVIHPVHLRYMAEKMGLIETTDPTAQKTIATLTRRLHLLNFRIQHLDNWLRTLSDTDHADLTYEIGFSGGTADMASEFCADFESVELDANTPKNGDVIEPQKQGALKPAKCRPAPDVQAALI